MKLRRIVSCMMALLLVAGMPLTAFADTWYLEDGDIAVNATESGQTVSQGTQVNVPDSAPVITQSNSSTPTTNTITITATENATANVTIQNVNIVNSDPVDAPEDHSGQAAVTIDVAENAEANVTLDGVDIDVHATGGFNKLQGKYVSGEAAVQITGNGDATIELDGENTVRSGYDRAGVEKNTTAATETEPANGTGKLTITDENEIAGSLQSTGGRNGAGIGGGDSGSGSNITITGSAEVNAQGSHFGAGIGGGKGGTGSNITITGSAEVTANGGVDAAGIGGGLSGSGSGLSGSGSDIEISGSAEVTAQGTGGGAGIGGGAFGSGSDIEITGSAEVTAKSDISGAGIGGGHSGSGSDITVSEDAQVKAQGGNGYHSEDDTIGTGAAIGGGGDYNSINGQEVTPNTNELTPNGKIEYYAPGADMETAEPIKTVTGTYVPPQPTEPVQPAAPYRVVGQDGKNLACKKAQSSGVLTITVDADFATLTGSASGLKTLKAQGVETIVFVTTGATSTFALADLLAQVPSGSTYALTHVGSLVTLTLSSGEDISSILK